MGGRAAAARRRAPRGGPGPAGIRLDSAPARGTVAFRVPARGVRRRGCARRNVVGRPLGARGRARRARAHREARADQRKSLRLVRGRAARGRAGGFARRGGQVRGSGRVDGPLVARRPAARAGRRRRRTLRTRALDGGARIRATGGGRRVVSSRGDRTGADLGADACRPRRTRLARRGRRRRALGAGVARRARGRDRRLRAPPGTRAARRGRLAGSRLPRAELTDRTVVERLARAIRHAPVLKGADRTWNVMRPVYDAGLRLVFGRSGLRRVVNGSERMRLDPRCRSVPKEYEPDVWRELLRRNLALNGWADVVEVRDVAVGSERGEIPFVSDRQQSRFDPAGASRVRVVTLDDELDQLALLKIDVEGFECAVLQGARRVLADDRRRPRRIFVEAHLAR